MDDIVTDPKTGEDIYVGDLMVGLPYLPPQQSKAFDLICLRGFTEGAARDVMLPNSKSSTPVQQYADSGLLRMVRAYDAKQAGHWPPPTPPKPIKKTKRRSLIMAALHPIVRQTLEAARKKVVAEIENLTAALKGLDEQLGIVTQPNGVVLASLSTQPTVSVDAKPDLKAMAKELTAAAITE